MFVTTGGGTVPATGTVGYRAATGHTRKRLSGVRVRDAGGGAGQCFFLSFFRY